MLKAIALWGTSLCAALGALSIAGAAQASGAGEGVHMPLGAEAAPPQGFLDFCRRHPDECGAGNDDAALRDVRRQAADLYWANLFSGAQRHAAPPTSTNSQRAQSAAFDWGPIFAGTQTVQAIQVARLEPASPEAVEAPAPEPDAPTPETVEAAAEAQEAPPIAEMTPALWRRVRTINARVNREIRRGDDRDVNGMEDYWRIPTGRAARGDCEDYVLTKRRALIDDGMPAEALSIAIVRTPWGESHAVLLLATAEGEYVLDNLTRRIRRWDRVNYEWRERQAPGRVFEWVSMAA